MSLLSIYLGVLKNILEPRTRTEYGPSYFITFKKNGKKGKRTWSAQKECEEECFFGKPRIGYLKIIKNKRTSII